MDIHRIRLPMVKNPLGYVNSYLIRDGDGCALVDCGWDTPDTLSTLQRELRRLGLELEDIRTLIVTHLHGDHYGLAGTLVRLVKPRLMLPRVDWQYVRTRLADANAARQDMIDWLERNGLSLQGRGDEERQAMEGARRFTVTPPDVELEDGDQVRIGAHNLRVVSTPGHCQGHICLYDAEHRLLLSGDHLLDPITPHVSSSRPLDGDLFSSCLASLHRIAPLDVDQVLPGHGEAFTGVRRRVDELLVRHERRETDVLDALSQGPAAAAEVAERLPWTRHRLTCSQLPPSRQRVAMGQTLAHLERLRTLGQVSRMAVNGLDLYSLDSSRSNHLPRATALPVEDNAIDA